MAKKIKNGKAKAKDHRHYWLTPPELYAKLDAEFHFDFDPAPYPRPEGFDGLTCEWGQRNYVNAPWAPDRASGTTRADWVRKAVQEQQKGKLVVMVFPVSNWIAPLLSATTDIRNLGNVAWCAIEDGRPGRAMGWPILVFILRPR